MQWHFKKYIYNRYSLAFSLLLVSLFWFLAHSSSEHQQNKVAERDYAVKKVKVQEVINAPIVREIVVNGQTFADRKVEIRAELSEVVDKVYVKQGERVTRGQLLIRLKNDHYFAELNQSKALLEQRRIQYKSIKNLNKRQLGSELQLSEALSALRQAETNLAFATKHYNATLIKAPFDGVLYDLDIEEGDYLSPGSKIVGILDYNKLIVKADVSQQYIRNLALDYDAKVVINDNEAPLIGKLTYISPQADLDTRSFPIEVSIDNTNLQDYAGMTARLKIALPPVKAFKISPALFALDDLGTIGVKIIDDKNQVVFQPVKSIKSDLSGTWVSGLADGMRLVIVGAGLVEAGDGVEVSR